MDVEPTAELAEAPAKYVPAFAKPVSMLPSVQSDDATAAQRRSATPRFTDPARVEQKGFEPSTPTLRTWCSPN
jgi:hypothetical protein